MNSTLLCIYCSETISTAPRVPEINTNSFGMMLTHCKHCDRIGPSVTVSANHMLVSVIALQRQLQGETNVSALKQASVVMKMVSPIPFYASEQQ